MDKIEIIIRAYQEMRISGLTTDPVPEELEFALSKLESMAAEWEDGRNICAGYMFEDIPDPNSDSGIKLSYLDAFATNLAIRMCASFGKDPKMTLMNQARQSFSTLSASTAKVRQVEYPNRMALGSGNLLRYNRWQRFYRKIAQAPLKCETQQISQGEINDYYLDLSDYLDLNANETVTTYTFDSSSKLTILSETMTATRWDYRVQAAEDSNEFQQVQLTIETDLGRKQTFTIDFNVTIVDDPV